MVMVLTATFNNIWYIWLNSVVVILNFIHNKIQIVAHTNEFRRKSKTIYQENEIDNCVLFSVSSHLYT